MGKKLLDNIVSVIDIGTTKICVLIATQDSTGKLELIGFGTNPSYGLKKGVIFDISKTVDSIKKAVALAEEMAGIKIENVAVGISGGHIKSFNSIGIVAIKSRDIFQSDVDRVIEAAKAVAIPEGQEVLHVLPQYFKVDGQDFILDSVGMQGIRLEAQVHIITGGVSSAQNIIKSCEFAGLKVTDIILEQIASADAVLTPSEKELGVGILDIGGGTSDFAIYKDGRIMHTKVLPYAGNHFTNDLAIGLGVSINQAEDIKKNYGFVWQDKYFDLDKDIIQVGLEYQDDEFKKIDTYSLYEILNPRAEEILDLLCEEIVQFRLRHFMPAGLVLTGGGSLLVGIKELAQEKFGMPVRIGIPNCYQHLSLGTKNNIPDLLKNPIYSTAYGLMIYASGQNNLDYVASEDSTSFTKVFNRMKSWIYDFL